ncbi:MAG: glycoside hydrolase family 15 protein [bacterium]|nr:glycoside hydrolase family 15 protein [bacterium]
MARSLVLGNGNVLLCFDKFGQVRDFYFPYVGLENHVGKENVHKIGVFADGAMLWLDNGEWKVTVDYEDETLASNIRAIHAGAMLNIAFTDIVYNETNIFLRKIKITNGASHERTIKLFFNQQLEISETNSANTAYYNPDIESIIHYKRRRVFLVGGSALGKAFDEYSTGLFKTEGKDGTWRDAENGTLSKNAVEHGSVDSTIGFTIALAAGESQELYYWVIVGETFREVKRLRAELLEKGPEHLLTSTTNFWHTWVNTSTFNLGPLGPRLVSLFKRSLLIIRTHADNRGAIIASGDSGAYQFGGRDTYSYTWSRDGSFTALALDEAGYHDITKRFFLFFKDVLTDEGYLLHKYHSDRSLGSSWHPWIRNGKRQIAFQEDETALVLIALWHYYEKTHDLEFIEELYNPFIKKAAEFLASYREKNTGLPNESYDLWEEKYGITTFTTAAVFGALEAAARFAVLLGKEEERKLYSGEAVKIRQALMKYLYNEDQGHFRKLAVIASNGLEFDETIDVSSFFGLYKFGVLSLDDPLLARVATITKKELTLATTVGGVARYKGDKYYETSSELPGNPWFVTTLWMLQYDIASAKDAVALEKIFAALTTVGGYALQSGVLSEQLHPFSGQQISVAPLTWSHAEFVNTVIHYLRKFEELNKR